MPYFVDYLQFTIHYDTDIPGRAAAYFYKYVNLEIEECQIEKGMHGYKQSLKFPSGIRVLFDGMPGMGIHVILPGTSLKNEHLEFNVFEIIEKLRADNMQYNISRIDVAIDTDVDFSEFYRQYKKGCYLCRYSKKSMKSVLNTENRGTLYFGKRGGNTMIRIYDKALEQDVADKVWTRVEMECRNDACEQAIEALKDGTIKNYFYGHLRFIQKKVDNTVRAKDCDWWVNMLERPNERVRFKRQEKDNTLEWFITQVAPTVKALRKYYGNDYVENIIKDSKISKRQIKERFDLRIVKLDSGYETLNVKTGELVESDFLKQEYIQECIKEVS